MTKATALLFPGQGSQEPNMGRDLADNNREIMDLWKKAEKISRIPLRSIYWDSEDPTLMSDTRNLQPALTLVNLSIWYELAPHVRPEAAAGHSLGEYSAYAASGALSAEKVLELVSLRGALMADADPDGRGGMAALLKLPREEAENVAHEAAESSGELLMVANYNTPAQFVLSGTKKALQAANPLVKARKGRIMPLSVSSAFHTPLMEKAAAELSGALRKMTWNRPRFALYSNVTGTAVTDGESLCELACRQMTSPVLWIDTIAAQWADGIRIWLEAGPKGVLSRMVTPILEPFLNTEEVDVSNVSSLESVQKFVNRQKGL